MLQVFDAPHVSYASTSNELSDSKAFPSFFRTVPQDDGQVRLQLMKSLELMPYFKALAMVRFALKMGWTYISVVLTLSPSWDKGKIISIEKIDTLDSYGSNGAAALKGEELFLK